MNQQLSLKKITHIFLHFWYIPVVLMIAGGFFSRAYAQHQYKPAYKAEAVFMIGTKHENSKYLRQQVDGELKLLPTYQDFITSETLMTKVHKNLKQKHSISMSVAELQKNVTVVGNANSLIMTLGASGRSKEAAVKQVNTVVQTFTKQISTISSTSKVKFITKATSQNVKTTSDFNGRKAFLYGAIVGAILGLLIEFIFGLFQLRDKA